MLWYLKKLYNQVLAMKREFKVNNNTRACPKCGNLRDFCIISQQVAEDLCELHIECVCGFDPTEDSNNKVEDVWGRVDRDAVTECFLDQWTEEALRRKDTFDHHEQSIQGD